MTSPDKAVFIDNPAVAARSDTYLSVTVDVTKVLGSWRESLFSYEWLNGDRLKTRDELPPNEQPKRQVIEDHLAKGEPLQKPILGIGILENVEFGSGRATFLTLAALGAKKLPVHILKAHKDEFSSFVV